MLNEQIFSHNLCLSSLETKRKEQYFVLTRSVTPCAVTAQVQHQSKRPWKDSTSTVKSCIMWWSLKKNSRRSQKRSYHLLQSPNSKCLVSYSLKSKPGKSTGSGTGAYPSVRSPCSMVTRVWVNLSLLLILPPAYQRDNPCRMVHRASRAVFSSSPPKMTHTIPSNLAWKLQAAIQHGYDCCIPEKVLTAIKCGSTIVLSPSHGTLMP